MVNAVKNIKLGGFLSKKVLESLVSSVTIHRI